MPTKKYKTSFTTGGLYYREARKVAELFLSNPNWVVIHKQIIETNSLQARTSSSLKRTTNEVIQRLQLLTEDQLLLLAEGDLKDQKDILWLAVCKHYEIIHEFAVKVIREKYLRYDRQVTFVDWDSFFNSKAEWDEGLEHLTDSTKAKLRQVIFRIMRESDILSEKNEIIPAVISPRVFNAIKKENSENLLIFPTTNQNQY